MQKAGVLTIFWHLAQKEKRLKTAPTTIALHGLEMHARDVHLINSPTAE